MSWAVKMWYFGKDSLTGYSGEKFEMKCKDQIYFTSIQRR